MSELLKACKRCEQLPKFSSYRFSQHTSYAIVCCTTVSDKSEQAAFYKWNLFNQESKNTFRLNLLTNKWEILEKQPSV